MSTLIMYASQYGNTQKIAEAIGVGTGSETRIVNVTEAMLEMLKGTTLLIVGSPTQGGRPMPAIQSFLAAIPDGALHQVKVAAFDTRLDARSHGVFLKLLMRTIKYSAEKIARTLMDKGGEVAAAPEGFFVTGKEGPLKEGEIERAKEWGKNIISMTV